MQWNSMARSAAMSLGLVAILVMGTDLFGQDPKHARRPPPRTAEPVQEIKPMSNPGIRHLLPSRPEFQPGGVERGEADEPTIAKMGADWSHGAELRAEVDRTEYRQLQRIHVRCVTTNVSGRDQFSVPPVAPGDRYLRMRVRVFDIRGKLVPMTEYYKHEGREPEVWIGGGGSTMAGSLRSPFRIDVIPNLVYDMTRLGEYWVLVEMQLHSGDSPTPNGAFYVRANPIKVKVIPEVGRFLDGRNAVIDPDRP